MGAERNMAAFTVRHVHEGASFSCEVHDDNSGLPDEEERIHAQKSCRWYAAQQIVMVVQNVRHPS